MPAPGALARPSAACCHWVTGPARLPTRHPHAVGGRTLFIIPPFQQKRLSWRKEGSCPSSPQKSVEVQRHRPPPQGTHILPQRFSVPSPGPGHTPSPGSGHPGPPLLSLDLSSKLLPNIFPSTAALGPATRSSRPHVQLACVSERNGGYGSACATGVHRTTWRLVKMQVLMGARAGVEHALSHPAASWGPGLPSHL